MDPNLRALAIRAHRGELKTKQQFEPSIRVYVSGRELGGFMVSFAKYAEYMKTFLDVTIEPVPEGDFIFCSMSILSGPMTCIRTEAVDAWTLPTS